MFFRYEEPNTMLLSMVKRYYAGLAVVKVHDAGEPAVGKGVANVSYVETQPEHNDDEILAVQEEQDE
jgi:hypothetical protein